ncbi:MAG: hypothetical protein QXV17_06840 [Candidatus Micrarchaeaceae archaeon]
MAQLIRYYCHNPTETILNNLTIGLYKIRKLEFARNTITGRFVSKRSTEYLANPQEYVTVVNFQVYNSVNGRIVTNFVCAYVKVVHAKHIAYDAERYKENRSIRGEVNITGYVRVDQIDYTNINRPILNSDVEDRLNKLMLEKLFEQDKFSWLEGIVEWDVIGTEVTDIFYPHYSENWLLEAWASHGVILPSMHSAEYTISTYVVIRENELYQ